MWNVLIRIGMAILGLAMLMETCLPPITEATKIDRHELVTRRDTSTQAGFRTETVYRLHFFGGHLRSCDVGITAYDATADGDPVTLQYSRIFKNCTAIDKGGNRVYADRGWRWFFVATAVFALLAALGVLPSFEFEGRRIY